MNILVLGGGGREHALAWKIAQSPLVERVFIAPGNPGTATVGENLAFDIKDPAAVVGACRARGISLVVVGPDDALASGIVDVLQEAQIPVFGPTKAAAEIEWSKAYAKRLMQETGIPTARSATCTDYSQAVSYMIQQTLPVVVKASGLALGKGVTVAKTQEEAEQALRECLLENRFGDSGKEVVVEEFLEGIEVSVHALCAGTDAFMFPLAEDHKRVGEGDTGPNTGGMGTIAPVPGIPADTIETIRTRIVLPLLRALKERERPFSGLLFPGVMLTKDGPKVIEFNARFGDPETESYMRLMKSDIVPALLASARGDLSGVSLAWDSGAVACIVLASGGYPGAYEKGKKIRGIAEAEKTGAVVFHAGTTSVDGTLATSGGRVLNVTATGDTLDAALDAAYAAVGHIRFDGMQYRNDIGAKALHSLVPMHMLE